MKKISVWILLAVLGIVFAGCQATPEELQRRKTKRYPALSEGGGGFGD